MKKYFAILFLSFLFGCKNKPTEDTVVGMFCGECHGNCFTAFKIQKGKVFEHQSSSILDTNNFKWTIIPDSNFKSIHAVLVALPSNMDSYPSYMGEPDAHDQCGIFVRIKEGTEIKTWMIDPDEGKHPKEFDNFVDLIMKLNLY